MALAIKSAAASSVAAKVAVKAPSANRMMVWRPDNNKMFETFSYLPPLSDDQIARQVDYIVNNGWTPCLEFSEPEIAYTGSESTARMGPVSSNYFDNRYWTMWKLPMFGCSDPVQVLREIDAATKAFPNAYIRMCAFDASRQVQVASMLVHRPASAKEWRPVNQRQV
jgi:ribulose-bisphosphate carboxylase small chain|eukprot:GHRR01000012.1.p1 GENE.GHRR01000012.1~~GHRR01000012.1.p1  ORF type:complete len:167 (+),score=34.30 GHRR01000012.1:102-602(+)